MDLVRPQAVPVPLPFSGSPCSSLSQGNAFTYRILSAQDTMFLLNQDLEDTAVLSLATIMLQRPYFRPESGVLVRHSGRPTPQQGLLHQSYLL